MGDGGIVPAPTAGVSWGGVTILLTGRRAASLLWEDSGPSPFHEIEAPDRSGGGHRSLPVLQPHPKHPRPAVSSLPGLKAEATPGCGQLFT